MADSIEPSQHPEDVARLVDKVVAIFGYHEDGVLRAKELRQHGVTVIFGIRNDRDEFSTAVENGEDVMSPEEAARLADVVQVW